MTDTMKELIKLAYDALEEAREYTDFLYKTLKDYDISMNFYFPSISIEDREVIDMLADNQGEDMVESFKKYKDADSMIVAVCIGENCTMDDDITSIVQDAVRTYSYYIIEAVNDIVRPILLEPANASADSFIIVAASTLFKKIILDDAMICYYKGVPLDVANLDHRRPDAYMIPGELESMHIFMKILHYLCKENPTPIRIEELEDYLVELERG